MAPNDGAPFSFALLHYCQTHGIAVNAPPPATAHAAYADEFEEALNHQRVRKAELYTALQTLSDAGSLTDAQLHAFMMSPIAELGRPIADASGHMTSLRAYMYALLVLRAAVPETDARAPFSSRLLAVTLFSAARAANAAFIAPNTRGAAYVVASALADTSGDIGMYRDDPRVSTTIEAYRAAARDTEHISADSWLGARVTLPMLEHYAQTYVAIERTRRALAQYNRAPLIHCDSARRECVQRGIRSYLAIAAAGDTATDQVSGILTCGVASYLLPAAMLHLTGIFGPPDPQCTANTALMTYDTPLSLGAYTFCRTALRHAKEFADAPDAPIGNAGDAALTREYASQAIALLMLYIVYQEHDEMRRKEDATIATMDSATAQSMTRTTRVIEPLADSVVRQCYGNSYAWSMECMVHTAMLADALEVPIPTARELQLTDAWYRLLPAIVALPGSRYGVIVREPGPALPKLYRCNDVWDAIAVWFDTAREVASDQAFVYSDALAHFGDSETAVDVDGYFRNILEQQREQAMREAAAQILELERDGADTSDDPAPERPAVGEDEQIVEATGRGERHVITVRRTPSPLMFAADV